MNRRHERRRRRSVARATVVRGVLAAGVVVVLATLLLELSQAAPRTAGSDRVQPQVFSAVLPHAGTFCQAVAPLPQDAARASVLIGTYYRPLPPVEIRFTDASGVLVAQGAVSGGHQGYVQLPIRRLSRSPAAAACVHVGGTLPVAIGGAGHRITIYYLRRGQETWWDLLPTIDLRFGLGKASFFGRWTLPFVALLVLALWAGTIRLLSRELR